MDDIYKNIEEYSPNKKRKMLIVFNDMISHMLINKKRNTIVTEIFIIGRKKHFSCFYYTILFFCKFNRLNSMHYIIMKIPNK